VAHSPTKSALSAPFGLEIAQPEVQRFNECVVLVPFYGGTKIQLRRHSDFLLALGFPVASFDLAAFPKGQRTQLIGNLVSSRAEFGVKHIWADQIEAVCNAIPGQKILFGFSTPSASAIEAIVRRQAVDIAGLICDSGPTTDLLSALVNYFRFEEPLRVPLTRYAAALALTLGWSPAFRHEITADMEQLPSQFRILSIRGWKDKIIGTHEIDQVFEPHNQIDWRKLSLPKAGHLNGLRDFASEYEGPVKQFLLQIATPKIAPQQDLQPSE